MSVSLLNSFLFIILSFMVIESQQLETKLKYTELSSYMFCQVDADCLENSFCYDNDAKQLGRCRCLSGFDMLIRNKSFYACLKGSTYKSHCEYSQQCVVNMRNNAVCDQRTKLCECADDSHYNEKDKQCYKSKKLHDICSTSAECLLKNGKNAYCLYGRCSCDFKEQPTPSLDECLASKRLGDACSSNHDCQLIENSYCGKTCLCRQGFSICRHGDFCLRDATTIGDNCTEHMQCVKNIPDSICSDNNKCKCTQGMHFYGSSCIDSVQIGDYCEHDFQCVSTEKDIKVVCKVDTCVMESSSGVFLYSVILLVAQIGFLYILY